VACRAGRYGPTMRMLLPTANADVQPAEVYGAAARPRPEGRPWLLANMVASADGGTAVDGKSGSLGGEPDRAVFFAIRAVADVILVAGGTVRTEGYGPALTPEAHLPARAARGQAPHPRLAIVSGSLDLDPTSRLFVESPPESRPIIVTSATADAGRRADLAAVADVIEAGAERVDVGEAVRQLGGLGFGIVLSEGGPSLLGQLADADLLDELCLTVAPVVVAGDSRRVVHGGVPEQHDYAIGHLLTEDDVLFLRYIRQRG